jgi:hypothetical protein
MTKFQQVRKALLDRPDYGMIGKREEMDRELWNKAIDSAIGVMKIEHPYSQLEAMEKLKA